MREKETETAKLLSGGYVNPPHHHNQQLNVIPIKIQAVFFGGNRQSDSEI
jgi:hypothetical protein